MEHPPDDHGVEDTGSVQGSPNLGPMTGAIHNISARHLHEIGVTVPDDRQFLRSWRRSLNDSLNHQHARIIHFLIADVSGETDVSRRCADILNKYSKPTWSFSSSIRDLALPTATADAAAWAEREIGIPVTALREYQRKTIRLYANTAAELCIAETHLEEKLKRLETVVSRVNDLMFLEPTASLEQMSGPARIYLDSVMDKIGIEEEYGAMTILYMRFALLKGLVSLSGFQKAPTPTCTICMTKEVSQAVTPCGHTFCDDCCQKQLTACYICRVQIRDKVRLYFN